MRNFFTKIGHFFRKRWAILTTAVVALFVGSAGGFALGQSAHAKPNFGNRQMQNFQQGNGQFRGQNGQMPNFPNTGKADAQGGASTGNGNSNSNSNGKSTQGA